MSWYFFDVQWNPYDPATNTILEKAFQQSSGAGKASFSFRRVQYQVDFTTLEQTNLSTQFVRECDRYDQPNDPSTSLQAQRLSLASSNHTFQPPSATTTSSSAPRRQQQQRQAPQQQQQQQQQAQTYLPASWEFLDRSYRAYATQDSAGVEALYQANNGTGVVQYSMNGYTYDIDFTAMTQKNTSTNVVRQLRRLHGVPLGAQQQQQLQQQQQPQQSRQPPPPPQTNKNTHPASYYVQSTQLTSQQTSTLQHTTTALQTLYNNKTAFPADCLSFPAIHWNKVQFTSQIELEMKVKQILCAVPTKPGFQSITFKSLELDEFDVPSQNLTHLSPSPDSAFTHDDHCSICLVEVEHKAQNAQADDVIALPCSHPFHIDCISSHLAKSANCPTCRKAFYYSPGPSPAGSLTLTYSSQSVPGEGAVGSILCDLVANSGVTDQRHTNHGVRYHGESRQHIIPATTEGFKMLTMFVKSFISLHVFSIGHSFTRNQDNVVIWNLHCKTSFHGGTVGHGYPDDQFYTKSRNEFRDVAGVSEEWL